MDLLFFIFALHRNGFSIHAQLFAEFQPLYSSVVDCRYSLAFSYPKTWHIKNPTNIGKIFLLFFIRNINITVSRWEKWNRHQKAFLSFFKTKFLSFNIFFTSLLLFKIFMRIRYIKIFCCLFLYPIVPSLALFKFLEVTQQHKKSRYLEHLFFCFVFKCCSEMHR